MREGAAFKRQSECLLTCNLDTHKNNFRISLLKHMLWVLKRDSSFEHRKNMFTLIKTNNHGFKLKILNILDPLISSLPGKSLRTLVESLGLPRDSTCVLELAW